MYVHHPHFSSIQTICSFFTILSTGLNFALWVFFLPFYTIHTFLPCLQFAHLP